MSNPASASRSAEPGATIAPDLCEQIFAAAIGDIVRFSFSARAALDYLQRLAERNIVSVDDRRASMRVLRARLEAFTEDDALRYGLEPDQYARWRAGQCAVAAPAGDTVLSGGPMARQASAERDRSDAEPLRAVSAAAPMQVDGTRPPLAPAAARVSSHVPARVSPPDRSSEPDTAAMRFQQVIADGKALLTPARIGTTAVWTGFLSSAFNHLVGEPSTPILTFLVAGVPPLLFLDRDREAAGRPMSVREKIATLITGGGVGMACGAPVTMIVEAVLRMLW